MHHDLLIQQFKNRRNMLSVNQETLADLSGVSLRTLKQFERGKGNPTLTTLRKMAHALGMEIDLRIKSSPPTR